MDDTIYQDDTCESCRISDHDNHRSIGQIHTLLKLAHTDETQFSFKIVDVAVIQKHMKNINIKKQRAMICSHPNYSNLGHIFYVIHCALYSICASPLVCFQIFLNRPKYVLYLRKETL